MTNNSTAIIANTFRTIPGAAIVIAFLADVVYFVTQVMDESSLNITLSIELDAIIVEIALYSDLQLLIGAVDCNTQVMHLVCAVFYIFFCIL